MPGWKCFLVSESKFVRLSFRRFTYSGTKDCGGRGHEAEVMIADRLEHESDRSMGKGEFAGDPRWPQKCQACGYSFVEEDQWQVNYCRLFGDAAGRLFRLRETPPGAMWIADWFPDKGPNGQWSGPDGKVWCLMMPGGIEWIVYSYSTGPEPRQKWSVSGTPPLITVSPSINIVGSYHGCVKDGVVSEDCEGRPYPGVERTA